MLVRFFETVPTAHERVGAGGVLHFRPIGDWTLAGDPDEHINSRPFTRTVGATGRVDQELAATGVERAWQVKYTGNPGWGPVYVQVTGAAGEPADWPELVRVDPATLEPTAEPEAAWWAAWAAMAVDQITLSGPLVLTVPAGFPAGQVYRCAITQDGTGGHTVTYGPDTLAIDTDPGASTLVEIWPGGDVVYPGATGGGAGLDTEGVQDIVGAMVTAAGGTYDDAAGSITLPAGGGTTRGLIITDTNVPTIPAGTTADNLAAYYNSGASAITVQGTSIAPGAHAVWAWVDGAWTLLASGAGTTPSALGAPTVAVESVTDTTVAVSYSTTTAGVTGWQYRLNGGAWSALDGASPDTITGLNPSTTYAIDVQYTVDGTAWSPMASVVTTTAQSAASYLRLSTTNATNYPLNETGDAATGYTYGLLWGAYQGFPAWTSTKTCPASGDFTVDVTIGEVRTALVRASDSAKDSIAFRFGTLTATAITFAAPKAGRPEPTGLDWYYTGMDGFGVFNSSSLPAIPHAPGDILRIGLTGTEMWTKISKDGGATWIDLYLKAGVTPAATKLSINGGSNAPWAAPVVITKPTYTGAWT